VDRSGASPQLIQLEDEFVISMKVGGRPISPQLMDRFETFVDGLWALVGESTSLAFLR